MPTQKILLIVGRDQQILDKLLPSVIEKGYDAHGAVTDDGAVEKIQGLMLDGIVLGAGVPKSSVEFITREAQEMHGENLKVVQITGKMDIWHCINLALEGR